MTEHITQELPELPKPFSMEDDQLTYTGDQLQAYGAACAAHAWEAALEEAMDQCMLAADCYEANGAAILAHDYIRALKKAGK